MAQLGTSITLGSIGPSATPTIGYSNAFIVVQSPWGVPNVPVLCSSFGQFLRNFGGLNHIASVTADGQADTWSNETSSTVVQGYLAAKAYFDEKANNPNGVAFIVRSIQSSGPPTAASHTFSDGGANNTTITSKWPGLAGGVTNVTIGASPKGSAYKRFTINHPQANITEVWDISNASDAADASKRSELVTITLPSGGQLPTNVSSAAKLNSGTGATADAFAATTTDMAGTVSGAVKTGLHAFDDLRLGTGFVFVPGKFDSTIRTAIKTHCETYQRMGLLGTASGLTSSTVVSDLSTTASNNLAYYWPNLRVSDPNSDSGGSVLVDPVGHIAGLAAKLDAQYHGPHKSPAGILHPFLTALDVERQSSGQELCDDATSNTLADSFINTLRVKGNPGRTVAWGLRTLATDGRYRQINTSRVVNLVYLTLYQICEPFAFEPIDPDGNLFARVRADVGSFLFQLRRDGVLFGTFPGSTPQPTDAYSVTCDKGNNTDITLANGELHVDVSIVPTPNAERVVINLLVAAPGSVGSKPSF